MDKLLNLLEKNPRLTNEEIALMVGKSLEEVEEKIRLYEESGVINGYRAIINKSKVNSKAVTALIEIKVQPKLGEGFDELAERIANFSEVESVYLVSGNYDLCCIVENKSFEEVAMFVVKRLSPLEGILSTTTNFILKRYKQQGVLFGSNKIDDRRTISL